MILHPGIIALLAISFISCFMLLYASLLGFRILRFWDLQSGSEQQLTLERSTYLASTLVSSALLFQLLGIFLFIHTVDSISSLFVGAMCAVGSLTVNQYGYPTLLTKLALFVPVGIWLILNRADNQGFDYPLIKTKYLLLMIIAPLQLLETLLQTLYFTGLTPDLITSCCGSLFSSSPAKVAVEMFSMQPLPTLAAFFLSGIATVVAGARYLRSDKGGWLFGLLTGIQFAMTLVALISAISPYIYELPSHHCPFCLLHKEYGHVGYLIYLLLLTGTVTGIGSAVLNRWRNMQSISTAISRMKKRLILCSMTTQTLLLAIVSIEIAVSNLKFTF
jgi:hypothetical protein